MTVASVEQFSRQLIDSGVMSEGELGAFLGRLPADAKPADGEQLARRLIKEKKISAFQGQLIYSGKGKSLTLGNYVIIDKLGQGGMGAVYRAKHVSMNRTVALKVLAPDALKSTNAVERFQREMRAAAHLEHPNIVSAYDAGQHNGQHYLAMQLIDGADLREKVVQNGPLSFTDALQFTLQTARGLEYAHSRGVIHRDIKPSNLLLTRDGSVKILDMGLARFEHGESDDEGTPGAELTGAGKIMGTVDFMSPEQALETRHADARSDIYSLGCTFYFLLTGHALYQEDGILKRLLAHRSAPIPSVVSERTDLPESVDHVLHKMLAKLADDRYQTMTEVIQALEGLAMPVTVAMAAPTGLQPETDPFAFMSGLGGREDSLKPVPTDRSQSPTLSGRDASMSTDTDLQSVKQSARRSLEQVELVQPTKSGSRQIAMLAAGSAIVLVIVVGAMFWSRPRGGHADRIIAKTESTTEKRLPQRKEHPKETISPDDVEMKAEEKPETPADIPDPVPPVTTPVTPPPDSTASPSEGGRTLVVGVAPGEISDLGNAFSQARPGDTILIRHRGPLELQPVDLTGKTPLTIAGDVKDDVDYWPIVRQVVIPEGTAVPPSAKGLFYGKNLNLTFRKVHLGIGGHQRQPIEAAFQLDAGRLRFSDCTITASASGAGLDPVGQPIPLVNCAGLSTERLELNLERTLIRGGRLGGLLNAVKTGPIQIVADQFLWAGGQAPWLTLQDCGHPCVVQLAHSTLYNLHGLANAALNDEKREEGAPILSFDLDHCLLTGPRVASPPLLKVSAPGVASLAQAVAGKWIEWNGNAVVWHQINGDSATITKNATPQKVWCDLFGLEERSLIVADPMFRVRPSGVELQEATGRDFEPRFTRAIKKPPRDADLSVGPAPGQLPVVLACVNSRNAATEQLAGVPRGPVRVLRVHQKDGPYQKLEDAISNVQSDDIIEIADNAVYVPTRNFSTSSANGVLSNESIECLSIRAVDESHAIITFRDDVQQGVIPGSARDNGTALFLLSTRCRFLSIDGLHFRTAMAKPTLHSLLFQTGPSLRFTNCTCIDTTGGPSAPGNRFILQTTHPGKGGATWYAQGEWLGWFENSAFLYAAPPQSLLNDPRQAEVAVQCHHYAPDPLSKVARNNVFRNCLFASNLIVVESLGLHLELAPLAEVLTFEQCTILGRMSNLTGGRTREKLICTDNLVIAPDNPVITSPAELLSAIQVGGNGNAYWQTAGAIRPQDRDQGSLSLIPGPLLKSMPTFSGNATAADILKPYRLKSGSALDRMATDGGPVGVRFEYLPAPPPLRAEMLKRDK